VGFGVRDFDGLSLPLVLLLLLDRGFAITMKGNENKDPEETTCLPELSKKKKKKKKR